MTTRAHITLVVDRSGSMSTIKQEAEAGIAKFITEQAALDGVKVKVSLYQFDDVYEHVFGPTKASAAPEYRLMPRAMTALYDAVGKGIQDTKITVANAALAGKTPDKVVVVIMTDGQENASKEHGFGSVTKLVEEQKTAGWEFIFLAGHLEAVKFGNASGLATRSFDPSRRGQTMTAYAGASSTTSDYLTGKADSTATPDTEGAPTA